MRSHSGKTLTAILLAGACYNPLANAQLPSPTPATSSAPATFPSSRPQAFNLQSRKAEIRSAATSYLETFILDYVRDFAPGSGEMRDNIKIYGGGEKGKAAVADGYVKLYQICLDTALNHLDKDLTQEELDEFGNKLLKQQKEMVKKTDLSLKHPAVLEAYKVWGKQKVDYFRRIAKANLKNNEKDFVLMARRTYTRQQFEEMFAEQNRVEEVLYKDGFKKSLEDRPLHIRIFGPGVIDSQQALSKTLNYREINRLYDDQTQIGKFRAYSRPSTSPSN
jgi:hypothetical protein